ncbi:MAG: hypothetical protein Q7U10_08730 [Thermodesulfovibrionia bacterium]|nr:hypothetical protein [Thermodesulfovibrionia bacterium]
MNPQVMEPIELADLKKGIRVPEVDFEKWLQAHDWTWHQLARNEFPMPFESLDQFQLACICADPVLWVQAFLREPEDPDHKEPYNLFDYQIESLRYPGHAIHADAAEVGKTREIVALGLQKGFTTQNGSGLIGAPMQSHLDEIIEAMDDQFTWNPDLGACRWHRRHKDGWKKHPHHAFYFTNGFKIDFKPSGDKGMAYRGVHARTFAFKDEGVKDKNPAQWSEFWRAVKPNCIVRLYSVLDGDRSCDFYKLKERAKSTKKEEEMKIDSLKGAQGHVKNIKFKLFVWPKTLMPVPYWTPERKQFYVEQYGGEDSAGYKHNVMAQDGDPENSVFPWTQFGLTIKDVPDYRCLKVLVDSGNNEVIVNGYKCEYVPGDDGPVPRVISLIDETYKASTFFDFNDDNESEFRKLIKSFFISIPGLKRGGGDFGFSGDPTELLIKSIIGKKERTVARLQLKHVTYDQQCQAIDAMDDVYGPIESIMWGTDFGNAGSAVTHILQGEPRYRHKNYSHRLKGFMFESTADNINEAGEPIIETKTQKPATITLKELATDILVQKMQRQELEYPPDPDMVLFYPNHTVRQGGKHRIYKKEDDHIIDADRVQILAKLFSAMVEDYFSSGSNVR